MPSVLMTKVIDKGTGFIVQSSPYGVFFIVASAAGKTNLAGLARIQGYLVILTVLIEGIRKIFE